MSEREFISRIYKEEKKPTTQTSRKMNKLIKMDYQTKQRVLKRRNTND